MIKDIVFSEINVMRWSFFILVFSLFITQLVSAISATTSDGDDIIIIKQDDASAFSYMGIDEYLSKLGVNVIRLTNNTAYESAEDYDSFDGIVLIGYDVHSTLRKTMFSAGQWDAIKLYVFGGGKLIVWHGSLLSYDIASDYYNEGGGNKWNYNGTLLNLDGDDHIIISIIHLEPAISG